MFQEASHTSLVMAGKRIVLKRRKTLICWVVINDVAWRRILPYSTESACQGLSGGGAIANQIPTRKAEA